MPVLALTRDAIDAIKAIAGAGEGGLRITTIPHAMNGSAPGLLLEPAARPAAADAVIEAEGARVYVDDSALEMLDDKVLDAVDEGDSVRFSVVEQL